MKKITIMLIFLASSVALFAQDTLTTTTTSRGTNEFHTIFGNKTGHCKIPLGFFLELNGGYSMFGSKSVFLPGMSIGLILDHHWTIGVTGSFIGDPNGLHYNNIYYDSATSKMNGAYLNGGYGGLLVEYTLMPRSRVHIAFPVMIGFGSMDYTSSFRHIDSIVVNNSFKDYHQGYISRDRFFVVEPGVRLEFNLIKSLRLGVGISYRYSPDFKLENTSPDLLNQFTAKLTLRFGKF
jgi:hypothetical protein